MADEEMQLGSTELRLPDEAMVAEMERRVDVLNRAVGLLNDRLAERDMPFVIRSLDDVGKDHPNGRYAFEDILLAVAALLKPEVK